MKKFYVLLILSLAAVGVRGALPEPDLIACIHFAGSQKLLIGKDSQLFCNAFSSAEALALTTLLPPNK